MILNDDTYRALLWNDQARARRRDGLPLTNADTDAIDRLIIDATKPSPKPPRIFYSDVELGIADLLVRAREVRCLYFGKVKDKKVRSAILTNVVDTRMDGEEVIAFKVYSPRAGDTLWCAKDASILPDEPTPVFFFDELPGLASKDPATLRCIYLVKDTFHGAMVAGARVEAAKVANPTSCKHCSSAETLAWRFGGKIIARTWDDGRADFGCSYCGRAAKEPRAKGVKKSKKKSAA